MSIRLIAGTVAAVLAVTLPAVHVAAADGARAAPSLDSLAFTGHGFIFNAKFKRLTLDKAAVLALQADLLSRLKTEVPQPDAKTAAYVKKVDAALQQAAGDTATRIFLQAAKANRLLDVSSSKFRKQFAWRNNAVLARGRVLYPVSLTKLSPSVVELLISGRLLPAGPVVSEYVSTCRKEGVPIPPDFDVNATSSPWVNQGRLTSNMLGGSEFAAVWTYSDPVTRGACVALPRGSGGPGTLAGIICQGAASGKACFWDNLLQSEGLMATRIPWGTQKLVINQLQDGTTLDPREPCTGCHVGNNVFLISPDDPVWRRVIRGPLRGPRTGTFTTRLESSPGVPSPTALYTPLSTLGWTNRPPSSGCGGACHAPTSPSINGLRVTNTTQAMPPICSTTGTGVAGCYGTP